MKKRFIIFVLIISVLVTCFAACNVGGHKVRYETDGNGTIQGKAVQTLKEGKQTSEVTAIPNEGYNFVKWSDNNISMTRTDIIEKEDLTFTAYFEKCKYSVIYNVNTFIGGGTIEGNTQQTVEHGGNATTVTAIPSIGYRFVKWLDNDSTNPVRTDTNITNHFSTTAIFERVSYDKYTVTYLTDGNGTIEGQASQQVLIGENAAQVTATPNEGYEFVRWSDGVTTATRQDLCITESKTVTAEFKCVYATYKLNYKLGEADTEITEFTFTDADFKTVEFPVPTRELFTFKGWYIGDNQVTNENGTMVVGKEILQERDREIYAKWIANETYTYKILMVYVTEVDALIPVRDGSREVQVRYNMADMERQICHAITMQMNKYLDDMFDGLVNFEVDEYFTENTITIENITSGSIGSGQTTHCIWAYNIPETSRLLDNYQTVLTSFSFNDYNYQLHNSSGLAHAKYGSIHFDTIFSDVLVKDEPIKNLLDLSHWGWDSVIDTYIHELAHTIEMLIDAYSYHSVLSYYQKMQVNTIEITKLYFNNIAIIDGTKVGIPVEFWAGELELKPTI